MDNPDRELMGRLLMLKAQLDRSEYYPYLSRFDKWCANHLTSWVIFAIYFGTLFVLIVLARLVIHGSL